MNTQEMHKSNKRNILYDNQNEIAESVYLSPIYNIENIKSKKAGG